MDDLQSFRLRLSLTQRAFARLTGLTQSELSRLETGKVERPQSRTIAAYVDHCGVTPEEFTAGLLTTVRRNSDPAQKATLAIEARIRDLFPRITEGQQIDLTGHLLGLGRELHRATNIQDIRWYRLASVAEECNLSLRALSMNRPTADFDVVQSALLGVMQMCGNDHSPQAAVDSATFRAMLLKVLTRRDELGPLISALTAVYSRALPVAQRYGEGFARAEDEFDTQWSAIQFESVDRDELPNHYGWVVAASHLLAGISDDLREQSQGERLQPTGSVKTS